MSKELWVEIKKQISHYQRVAVSYRIYVKCTVSKSGSFLHIFVFFYLRACCVPPAGQKPMLQQVTSFYPRSVPASLCKRREDGRVMFYGVWLVCVQAYFTQAILKCNSKQDASHSFGPIFARSNILISKITPRIYWK